MTLKEVDGSACRALRRVFVSGEALPPTSVAKFIEVLPDAQLHNLYGPTEATVDVTGQSSSHLIVLPALPPLQALTVVWSLLLWGLSEHVALSYPLPYLSQRVNLEFRTA